MIPARFEYHAAKTVPEAVALLDRYGEDAKVLAGGQSLLPMMKLRLAEPRHLVDIGPIGELRTIREEGGFLYIGAGVSEAGAIASEVLGNKCPLICETARQIGDPQVRNRGTLGGNLAHGDPGNDQPAVMLALGASVILRGKAGERSVSIDGFYRGLYETQLQPGELLVNIRIPVPSPHSGYSYRKLKRKTGDFATAAAAVQLSLDSAGNCARIGIALTNVAPMAVKVREAEQLLTGKRITTELIEQAAQIAMRVCDPAEDLHGPAEYRIQMAGEMTRRAIGEALARASRH
jgi:carbon-monoxide dehydrogenase medium subunit